MTNELPRKLSTDRHSPLYDPIFVKITVTVNGVRRNDVHEYDMDEGYVSLRQKGKTGWAVDTAGNFIVTRVGTKDIVPAFRIDTSSETSIRNDALHIEQAELKRKRKAEKLRAQLERNKQC